MKKIRDWDRTYWGMALLLFVCFVFLMPLESHSGDRWYWWNWAKYCFEFDLGTIYEYKIDGHVLTNYHPLYLHALNIFQSLFDSLASLKEGMHRIKIFAMVFDFLGAFSIFLLVKKDEQTRYLPFFLLFNIAYIYNSIIWGQIDAIFTNFALLAIIFAIRQQAIPAILLYILAINTKLQAIIFFPLIGLLLLPPLINKWKSIASGLGLAALLQTVLLWPFIQAGQLKQMYLTLTAGSVDLYPCTSIAAYNLWYFFFHHNSVSVSDAELFYGISLKHWGMILFSCFSALALFPLALRCLRIGLEQKAFDQSSKELVFLAATLISLSFFFFNTQMHERYSHPALILSFFYAFHRKNYFLYVLISVAYFLNVEKSMKTFNWHYADYILIFNPIFIASLFAFAIFLVVIRVLRVHSPIPDLKHLWARVLN